MARLPGRASRLTGPATRCSLGRAIGPVEQRIQDGLDAASLRPDAVLEALSQGLLVLDSAGRTRYCNQAAAEMLGLQSRLELLDVPLDDHPELRVGRDGWVRLATGEGRRNGPGADERWVRVERRALRGHGGEPLELLVLEDVSERRPESDRERFVARAAEELSRSLDLEVSLRKMARLAVPGLADWCAIEVRRGSGRLVRGAVAHADPDRERWAAEDPRRFPSPATAPGLSSLESAGLVSSLSAWIAADARGEKRRLAALSMLELTSAAIVPLRGRGRLLGAMTLATAESSRSYSSDDLELFERLADRYAVAFDNARLFRDQQRTAARLQRSLRPRRLAEVPGLDVAAHYQPVGDGAQAGGDFYDLFPAGHGTWVAVLGDVSGKGIDAAASSALMRHTLRAAASGQGRLPRALALADEILEAEDEDRLCSAVVVRARVAHGRARLTLANAGHPPPLVLRRDGTVVPVVAGGSILGVSTSRLTEEIGLELAPGDALVLYTDGVTEARVDGGLFAEQRLTRALGPSGGQGAESVVAAVRRALAPPVELRDDVAVMVIAAPEER